MDIHAADDPIRAALLRDDPAAVELLWDRYAGDLLAFLQVTLRSGHDAEDVLQAVFVRIVRKRRRLAKARRLDPYIYQIARNEASRFLKSRQRRRAVGPDKQPYLSVAESGDVRKLVRSDIAVDTEQQIIFSIQSLVGGQREDAVIFIPQALIVHGSNANGMQCLNAQTYCITQFVLSMFRRQVIHKSNRLFLQHTGRRSICVALNDAALGIRRG